MDSLRIDTGAKKLLINDGPEYIEFNPADVSFAERFYQLIQDLGAKQAEYRTRSDVIEANKEKDANGVPANFPEELALIREACEFMREKIDVLFGRGTSQAVFGDTRSLGMFEQFFAGITPFIQTARAEKVAKYIPHPVVKKRKRAVMK